MPDLKISQLTLKPILGGSEEVPVNDGGTTKKVTVDGIAARAAFAYLGSVVLAAPAASVSFSSIPGSYRHLLFEFDARCDVATTSDPIQCQFNGDTGANQYEWQLGAYGDGTSVAASRTLNQTSLRVGYVTGATSTAGWSASGWMKVYNYAGTNFQKNTLSDCILQYGSGAARYPHAGHWKSTAAITSALFFPFTGAVNFVTGTRFDLYAY